MAFVLSIDAFHTAWVMSQKNRPKRRNRQATIDTLMDFVFTTIPEGGQGGEREKERKKEEEGGEREKEGERAKEEKERRRRRRRKKEELYYIYKGRR